MDKIRFKECINYPLYYSKNPDHLSKPLKAWEKVVGTLAFVALTLLAGSFFYIKNLRIKATKNPSDKLTSKITETASSSLNKKSSLSPDSSHVDPPPSNPFFRGTSYAKYSEDDIVDFLKSTFDKTTQTNSLSTTSLSEVLQNLPPEDKQALARFSNSINHHFEEFFTNFPPLIKDYFFIETAKATPNNPNESYYVALLGRADKNQEGKTNGFSFTSIGFEHHFKTLDADQILDIFQSLIRLKCEEKSIPIEIRKENKKNLLGLRLEINPSKISSPPPEPTSPPPPAPSTIDLSGPTLLNSPQTSPAPTTTTMAKDLSREEYLVYIDQYTLDAELKNQFKSQINKCSKSDLTALNRVIRLFEQNLTSFLNGKKAIDNKTFWIFYQPSEYKEESPDSNHFVIFKGQRTFNNSGIETEKNVFESFYIENEKIPLEDLSTECIKEILKGYCAANFPIQPSTIGVRPIDSLPSASGFRFALKS